MKKNYKTAPLPFQGQKRFFVESFKKALIEMNKEKEIKIIVDLFGGSGLLSHAAKQTLPSCQVVYNDFDNYHQRIVHVPQTNKILEDFREIVKEVPKLQKLDNNSKARILERLKFEVEQGRYIDYISISASVLFSGNYATNFQELTEGAMYNRVRKSNFEPAGDYLDGIDVLRQDYMVLYERYKNNEGVIFLVDPPYLSTDTSSYGSNYWKLSDYLNVLKTIRDSSFVYFTSNKSQIIELLDWFNINYDFISPFVDAKKIERKNSVTHNAIYTDIMLYKRV